MTVNESVALAVAVALAARGAQWLPGSAVPPIWVAALLVAASFVVRSARGLILTVMILAFTLGVRSYASIEPIAASTEQDVEVQVQSDPTPVNRGLRMDISLHSERLEAWAFGAEAGRVRHVLAGDTVVISGVVTPRPVGRDWLAYRGVAGRFAIAEVSDVRHASGIRGFANGLRLLVERGAMSLSPADRALLTGFVFGDDRYQFDEDRELFRNAGLGHLLAVSGQNVAFFLALLAPALQRMTFPVRLPATVLALVFFALLTRFEPSVLRATCMAGGSAVAAALGREADSRRVLSLAVAGLILWNPLLIHRLAFQLSVAASAGILWLSAPIAGRLPGPRPLALGVAVTAGAQLAVTPLLLLTFGSVPLASLPANVLAGPASGPVMVWGMTGGLVAGIVGGDAATVLHQPTRLLLWWIRSVATITTGVGLPPLGVRASAVIACGCLAARFHAKRVGGRGGTRSSR